MPGEPVRYCEHCGKPVSPEARFCGACGRPSAAAEAAKPPAEPEAAPPAKPGAETEVMHLRPLAVQTFAEFLLCVITLGIAWIVLRIRRMATTFRITTQRIEIRTGVMTKTTRSVDLYRIQDLEMRQPFFLRMRAAGDVIVRSMDPGEPVLLIPAVSDVENVHETLRSLAQGERRRMNVRLLEEQS